MHKFFLKQYQDIKVKGFKELLKKILIFFNILILLPVYFFSFIIYLFIIIISPVVLIRIGCITSQNFGDFVSFTAQYYMKKKLKLEQPKKNYIDLIYIPYKEKIYNKQLEKMWRRKFKIYRGFFLYYIEKIIRFMPLGKTHLINNFYASERDINNLKNNCQTIEFTNSEMIEGRSILKKFGLGSKSKFVCLAVRDGAWDKIKQPFVDTSYQNLRNQDINDFYLAADELTKKGYFVFRMGVKVKDRFITNNPKIIDYSNSKLRSDFMDIFLGANCEFCISTGLGFQDLPMLFNRPLLILLSEPIGYMLSHSEKFFIFTRAHVDKKTKEKLTLKQIFERNLAFETNIQNYQKQEIELKKFEPEEIRDFVLEMLDYINGIKIDKISTNLQNKFRENFKNNFNKLNYHKNPKNRERILHGVIRARYFNKFLNQNLDWLN